MTEHPNALLIHQAWQAISVGDVETVKALWAEDIVWHVTGDNPWQGSHVGVDAVLEYLAQVGESCDSYDTTLVDVLASADHAALFCHISTKRDGRVLKTDQVLLARMQRGRVCEVWTLSLDPESVRRFWSQSAGQAAG